MEKGLERTLGRMEASLTSIQRDLTLLRTEHREWLSNHDRRLGKVEVKVFTTRAAGALLATALAIVVSVKKFF